MTNETVYVPREVLERLIEEHITVLGFTNPTARDAQLALCAQPMASEPVAWIYQSHRGTDLVRNRWSDDIRQLGPHGMTETPLYRHPPTPALIDSHECKFNLDMEGKCFYCANKEGSINE